MKSLTIEQFTKIVEFVQKHHRFGYVPDGDRVTEYAFNIKYIDSVYDTRDMSIWSVGFRGMGNHVVFRTNTYNALHLPSGDFQYDNLYSWIIDYLEGKWVANEDVIQKVEL